MKSKQPQITEIVYVLPISFHIRNEHFGYDFETKIPQILEMI